ncbi:MAG: Fe2+ transport system protein FeoA [Candidatus Marinamargulisbacteria bacterium]|jgi:Fe2+ transport system protein FeoA
MTEPVTRNVSQLKKGERGRIKRLTLQGPFKKRLQHMGVVTNEWLEVVDVAPLGDPIKIRVKNYHLSLRKEEAQGIEVVLA